MDKNRSQSTLAVSLVPSRDGLVAALLSAGAFLMAFVFVYPRQWTRGFLINDEMWFAALARHLSSGDGFVSNTLYPMLALPTQQFPVPEPFKQVAYPLFSAAAWSVTGVGHHPMILIALLAFAALIGATYLLAKEVLESRSLGAVTAALVVCNPTLLALYTAATPEPLFAFLFVVLIGLLLEPSLPKLALSGVCHAAMLMTKGVGLIYVPVVLAYIALNPRARSARAVAAYVFGLGGTIALAAAILPAGSIQLFGAGGNYSVQFLFETSRYGILGPYFDTDPIEPFRYIVTHPLEFGEKYLRLFGRTKVVVEALGGPAFGGLVFVAWMLAGVSVLGTGLSRVRQPDVSPTAGHDRGTRPNMDTHPYAILLMCCIVTLLFAFLWAILFRVRYIAHVYPIMLIVIFHEARRLRFDLIVAGTARRVVVVFVLVYGLLYPGTLALWDSYRHPQSMLGRGLPIHIVSYENVRDAVSAHVPHGGVVISELAHEIDWLTGHPTIHFPLREDQLRTLVDRYDVQALYERPDVQRSWGVMEEKFELIESAAGRLWVRRTK